MKRGLIPSYSKSPAVFLVVSFAVKLVTTLGIEFRPRSCNEGEATHIALKDLVSASPRKKSQMRAVIVLPIFTTIEPITASARPYGT